MTRQEAAKLLRQNFGVNQILAFYKTPKFIEAIANTGGDVRTFRVYENGTITEK